jgi:hypothetical protein
LEARSEGRGGEPSRDGFSTASPGHPGAAIEVIDLRDAVDAVLADHKARTWAERNLMSGDECDPPKVTVCDVRTHREHEVYPPASEFALEVVVLNAQAATIVSWEQRETVLAEAKVAATYNQAVRVFRSIRRLVNPPRERQPIATTARWGGRCSRCPDPVFVGQRVFISNSELWHVGCSGLVQTVTLRADGGIVLQPGALP